MKKLLLLTLASLCLVGCGKEETKDKTSIAKEETHYEIVSVQPFYTSLLDRCSDDTILGFPEGVTKEPDLLIKGATNLATSLENVSYKAENTFKDSVINKETFSKFGKNQVILIQSHGDYFDEYLHETIVTGEDYIEEDIAKEDEERIVESSMFNQETGNMMSAITPQFVDAYCPDISGSIVYMGQCHGAHDWALATSFLDKGAIAVYGATLAIQMHYGDMMQYRVTSLLGEVNPKTNNYYTTSQALAKAQEEYGIDDSVKYLGGANGARVILLGDPNFRLASK